MKPYTHGENALEYCDNRTNPKLQELWVPPSASNRSRVTRRQSKRPARCNSLRGEKRHAGRRGSARLEELPGFYPPVLGDLAWKGALGSVMSRERRASGLPVAPVNYHSRVCWRSLVWVK